MYFSDYQFSENLFNYNLICEKADKSNEKCRNIMTIYWLLVSGIIFLLISFTTLFPFFVMKKKK